MMDQEEFEFDDPDAPYQRHSEESFAAAEQIEPDAATLRGQVLAHIRKCGILGATDDEMQVALRMNPSTQRPRRIELWRMGLVVASDSQRLTRSLRWAKVWIAKDLS